MSRSPRPRGGVRGGWVVASGLLLAPVLGLAAWAVVADLDDPTAAAAPIGALLVPVTSAELVASTSVGVVLEAAPGREVLSQGTGLVTAAPVVGATLDNGDEAMGIDGRSVRAMVSTSPLWRDLAAADKGADVALVQEYLSALGYYTGTADGVFGASLQRAVAAFNKDAGLAPTTKAFLVSSVIWIGPQPQTVSAVVLSEGAQIAPGDVVFTGPPRMSSVLVTEPSGGIAATGDYTAGAQITVNGVTVAYQPGSGVITDPELVAAITGALAPATEGTAQVSSTTSIPVRVVPASALVTGLDGTTCVYARPDAEPTLVAPIGGGNSSVQLDSTFALTEVLANPNQVAVKVPCGS